MMKLKFEFVVHVEKDGDGYYAFCPGIKGLHVDGATEEEAIENATEGVRVRIESLLKDGEPLPVGVFCSEVTPAPFFRRLGRAINPPAHQGRDQSITAEVALNH